MYSRKQTLSQLTTQHFDVLVLGGGINGAVTAAALSAQGAKVALIDQMDFAIGSSSNSSNLAWGGIKYLESGELFLVKKLCKSRNHLMDHYPSRVKEIRFFTTINRGFRWPAWMIYCGAFFYWLIGACRTEAPRYVRRKHIAVEEPIINADESAGGVEYSDCYLPGNDARFVFNFIRSGIRNGAVVANYVAAQNSVHHPGGKGHWQTELRDQITGEFSSVKSTAIVNACGPYVDHYNQKIGQITTHRHVFSKGVHLIVPQLTTHERILAFFASDGRLFFVIPMGQRTCIGTTDTPVEDPKVEVTDADRQFILDNANQLLSLPQPLTQDDIIAERCGVRPLVVKRGKATNGDWLKLSRKHEIICNSALAYISVFGGKITDCINVGNEIVRYCEKLNIVHAGSGQKWYGEPSEDRKQIFLKAIHDIQIADPSIKLLDSAEGESISERWWRRFGEQAYELLELVKQQPGSLTYPIPGQDYCACEIAFMGREEIVVMLDDFLRRRTKIALTMNRESLCNHPGLIEVASLLFGEDRAKVKVEEYRRHVLGVRSIEQRIIDNNVVGL